MTLKNSLFLIINIINFILSFASATATDSDSLMRELETVLNNRIEYLQNKEKHITDLKLKLLSAEGDERSYELMGELFDAYRPFNTDSAYYYSLQRDRLAKTLGDPVRIANSRMNQANVLLAVGMYHEVAEIMKDIQPNKLPDYLRPYYYYIMRTLKGNMADFSAFSPIRARYNAETCSYRDSIIKVNEPGTLAHVLSVADQYNAYGRHREAVKIMTEFMRANELSEHDKAICAWTLADAYEHLGDIPKLKEQLIISSIGDMKAAVREYVSLRQLALLLYKEGDFERAYRFMNIAMDDANKSNARQRLVELSALYPEVTDIYVQKIQEQRRSLQITLWVIGFLVVVLILALIYVWKQMKVISNSRHLLASANDSLNSLNDRLKKSNLQLNAANNRLQETVSELNDANASLNEANEKLHERNKELREAYQKVEENSRLKEAYIGKYMDQCVMQIDSLDSYRKSLLKIASSGKMEDIRTRLKSTDGVDDRLKGFYENFDKTFLDLFPNFVEDFNALLLPEEAIVPKRKGTLNTELRIFALIRLGITDSDKIAKFLRYSVTTIYNYRTKVRNKAAGDRDSLEDEVRKL